MEVVDEAVLDTLMEAQPWILVDEGVESGYVNVDSLTEDHKKKLRKAAKITECDVEKFMYNLKERMDDLVHFFNLHG